MNFKLRLAGVALLALTLCTQASELAVQEETLGPWHYLYPLEHYENGPDPQYSRDLYAPTAVTFAHGWRIAVILPGSHTVAEFLDGKFADLRLPSRAVPLSLAEDRDGRLCCLFRQADADSRTDWAGGPDWIALLNDKTRAWSRPVKVPLPVEPHSVCDHIEFDSKNRLWALGPSRVAAVLRKGTWDTFAYSDDKNLRFDPMRLAEDANGDITLFTNWSGSDQVSRMPGILVYRQGKFIRFPGTDPQIWRDAQKKSDDSLTADNFDRSTGYVCHSTGALNRHYDGPKTVLRTDNYRIVSLANDGLAWTRIAELSTASPLTEDAEWEKIDDVTMAPAADPSGVLWLGRNNPPRLVRVGADATQEFPSDTVIARDHSFTLFDQRGRPWFLGRTWIGQGGSTVLFDHGFQKYSTLVEAMQAHAADFKPGNIFAKVRETDRFGEGPGVLKTSHGQICFGGNGFENLIILDGDKTLEFAPAEINPEQANNTGGHGYNPFSHGEPREDATGDITTCVDNVVFRYHDGKWLRVGEYVDPTAADPSPDDARDDPFATPFMAANGRVFRFRGFHFYEKTNHGPVQIDFGLNPLASYPFWRGWYGSPGMTQPRIDPTGKIWISSVGPYSSRLPGHSGDSVWSILRKLIP